MKKIFTLLFFVFLYTAGYAQVWNQLPNDGNRTNRSAAFAINGTGYFFLGGYSSTVLSYDTTTHVWASIENYPEGNTDGTVGCSLNGFGYAGIGVQYSTFSNSFYRYNPTNNTWKTLPDFPGTVRAYGAAFALDGKIYMGGGLSSGSVPNNDFYAYDPADSTWTPIASCPARGVGCDPVAFVIGDKAYVGTGGEINSSQQSVPQKDFWEYDTTSKVWAQIDSLPGSARAEASAFSTCDRGFVGLGYTNIPRTTDVQDFWQYNPLSGKWTQIADYGAGAANGAGAVTIGNTGYVAGGLYISSTVLYDLWSYAPSAIPAFSADTSVCAGGSVTFEDTSNFSPDHWYWQFPGGTPDTSTKQSATITYDTVGTYNVILTAWNGCDSGTKTFTNYMTVGAGGILSINPSKATICSGQSISLVITNDTGASFTWAPLAGLSDSTGDSVIATPSVTTTYTITGTGSAGCAFTGIDTITVNSPPSLTILPQPAPLFCSGLSAELKVQGGGSNFIWVPSTSLSASTGDSVLASPLESTTYTVTGNDSAGCASSGIEVVNVIASPNKPTFYQHGDTLTSSATTDNQWYMNGLPINGDTSQNLIINNTSPDSFYVVVESEANGCSTSSDTTATTGINQLSLISNQLSIYPNPFNNGIFITINSSAQNVKDWNLQIIDVLGRTVYSQQSLNYNNDINLSDLPSGVYFITVINKAGKAVVPVVKQN